MTDISEVQPGDIVFEQSGYLYLEPVLERRTVIRITKTLIITNNDHRFDKATGIEKTKASTRNRLYPNTIENSQRYEQQCLTNNFRTIVDELQRVCRDRGPKRLIPSKEDVRLLKALVEKYENVK